LDIDHHPGVCQTQYFGNSIHIHQQTLRFQLFWVCHMKSVSITG